MADLGNPKLYSYTRVGTKRLVDEFTAETVSELKDFAADCAMGHKLEIKSSIELFRELKHSYGNTALLLSGGGSLGAHHIGIMKALTEQDLLPRIICGSSSGALMAAFACTRTEDEYDRIVLPVFWKEPNESGWLPAKLVRFIREGVLMDSVHLGKTMRENIGDITFLEAYQMTRRILNITVSSTTVYEVPRLLNYLTAPHVLIWSATEASCAVPGVFGSRRIMAKDPKTGQPVPWQMSASDESRWIDGSMENDIPMRRLAELFNVNHFIVAQVNPHVYPFLKTDPRQSWFGTIMEKILALLGSELRFRLSQLSRWGIFPHFCHRILSLMSQPYVGDITIVPKLTLKDIFHILAPSTPQSVKEAIDKGERATWPYISMIRNRCAVEMALEEILYNLRCKLVEGATEYDSRSSSKDKLTSPSTRSLTLEVGKNSESSTDSDNSLNMTTESPIIQPNQNTTPQTKKRHKKNRKGSQGHPPSRRLSVGPKII